MTSSGSSSDNHLGRGVAVAAALAALTACKHVLPPPKPPGLFAVFPVQNASGGPAPVRALSEALEAALTERGLPVVPRKDLEAVMARNRIRYTGGVDRPTAKALAEELGVEAVLVPTLEQYSTASPPKVSIAARFVDTSDRPTVLWADSIMRAGDDAPGLLALGMVETNAELDRRVISAVAGSVESYVKRGTRGASCGEAGHLRPRRIYRAPELDDVGRRTIAVLPFENRSDRRGANEVLLNQFVAQLTRSGAFEVLDPGFVREEFLAHRIVLEGGVSIDRAMTLLDLLSADLVLSGVVERYVAPHGLRQAPLAEFTAYVIDRDTAELVWSSASHGDGDDWVHFFGLGRERTSSGLTCRMVRGVVDGIVGSRLQMGPRDTVLEAPPQGVRSRSEGAQFQRRGRVPSSGEFYENARGARARGMNQASPPADQTAAPQEPHP
jgi:TolB-like protein